MKLEIKGMHCNSCKLLVEDIMEDINIPVKSLEVDEEKKIGTLEVDSDEKEKIIAAIKEEADYEAKEIGAIEDR